MSHPEIKLSAYARSIGLEIDNWEDGLPVLGIQYSRTICGNPGMFHGGAISTVLEAAAVAALDANLRAGHGPAILTPLNSTIQFLRAAGEERAFASAQIVKLGRRLANVTAVLWQASRDKPAATAVVNVAITPMPNT
jgi:uncharacterized protein (TIGR00369 family)